MDTTDYRTAFTNDEIDAALLDLDIFQYQYSPTGWASLNGWQYLKDHMVGWKLETQRFRYEVVANTFEEKGYEEISQGGEDFYIVLKVTGMKISGRSNRFSEVNDDRFFKKTGHQGSYGDVEWTSGLVVTQGVPKTVFVFE